MDTVTVEQATPKMTGSRAVLPWKGACFGAAALALAVLAAANATVNISEEASIRYPFIVGASSIPSVEKQLGKALKTGEAGALAQAARASLAQQAYNPVALQALGVAYDIKGDEADALRAFELSERFSRREIITQFWLIEHAVGKGDVPEVLRHYDVALRTSPKTWQVLFPILDAALTDADIRRALVPYLSSDSPWIPGFLNYAATNGVTPESLAALVMEGGGLDFATEAGMSASQLFIRLAALGDYEKIRLLYLSASSSDRDVLTTLHVSPQSTAAEYSPVTWSSAAQAGGTADASATFSDDTMFVFSASGSRREAARKLAYLVPGKYQLVSTTELRSGEDASAQWKISCHRGMQSTELKSGNNLLLPESRSFQFDVPRGCDAVSVILFTYGGSGQFGAQFEIKNIELTRK